jgi:hypothetical protein
VAINKQIRFFKTYVDEYGDHYFPLFVRGLNVIQVYEPTGAIELRTVMLHSEPIQSFLEDKKISKYNMFRKITDKDSRELITSLFIGKYKLT